MNPTLQRAVTSFYNLVYEAQTFATAMARIDTAEQEHYAGRIEGLNWVLDRCQELEDMDANLTPSSLQRVLTEVKSDLDHELSVQRREKGRRADGREEALNFVADYLSSLITATEIESAKTPAV
ncbi:conserved protein of unknown function [Nitrospira japonica]|jgi:hypothetical protein|uniref:Uncharacterized protein n=1 Tax=Nitrospira japonica TaxID=1325564 RepID=A0A1W1I3L2_9BACT|nr:hypothetical protein [Nitrospira japonica]MDF0645677.1 hypothetical protein [Nitrospira sp.]SLM47555.1 conserved protein of unknown function [Nitrospira japonica]HJT21463.1 hypothetical protein [Nitrospira sp.]HMU56133.1 hypothetical protein [Nitrospira sp.]